MKFDKRDFAEMEFKGILDCEKIEDVEDRCPGLLKIPMFADGERKRMTFISFVKVAKYINLIYDKNSPLLTYERNIVKRKKIAAEVAEFKMNKERTGFSDRYQRILDNKEPTVNQMAVRFIIHQKDMKYSQYIKYCENYYKLYLATLENEKNPDLTMVEEVQNDKKLHKQMDELYDDIDRLFDEIFIKDKVLGEAVSEMVEEALEAVPMGHSELYANKLEKNES